MPVDAKEWCDCFLRLPGSPQLFARMPGAGSRTGGPPRAARHPVFRGHPAGQPANGLLGLQENFDFTSKHSKQPGLIHGLMCYHTLFTCEPDFIRKAFEMAGELGCLVHMHCSEGMYETEYALEHYGRRPIQFYDQLGVLGPTMLASQCVQLDMDEVALLARRGAQEPICHYPTVRWAVGFAPIPQLVAAGVTVGLGSDSYIDNFFEVMRGAFLIHKANQRDPRLMPASLVYYIATEGGAHALHIPWVGRIAPGWKADLQLIDAAFPTPAADWNLYDQLILYRNPEHVRLVMVDGNILLETGVLKAGSDELALPILCEQAERLWQAVKIILFSKRIGSSCIHALRSTCKINTTCSMNCHGPLRRRARLF